MGDFGCHDLDNSLWALDLNAPLSVEAFPAGNMDAEIAPHGEICYYEFGPRGDKPPVKITWYDGGLQPPWPHEMGTGRSLPDHGVLFIGDKGKLLTEGWAGQQRLLPYEKTAAYKKPPKTLPRSKGHHRDWLDACKGGPSRQFQLPVRRPAYRTGAAGSPRLAPRQTDRLGRGEPQGPGRGRSRRAHQRATPQGLGNRLSRAAKSPFAPRK